MIYRPKIMPKLSQQKCKLEVFFPIINFILRCDNYTLKKEQCGKIQFQEVHSGI